MTIFARIAAYLHESSRLELLSRQFGFPVEEIESTYLPADPSKGKYLTWILKQVKVGQLRFPEDHNKTSVTLADFDTLKKSPHFRGEKDVNKYKSYGELARVVYAARFDPTQQSKGGAARQRAVEGTKLVKEWNGSADVIQDGSPETIQGKFAVYEVTTHEAMLALGARETEWCVKDPKYFEQYAKKGLPFYLATVDGEPSYLLHLPTQQCMDKWDDETDPHMFEQAGIDCWTLYELDDVVNQVTNIWDAVKSGSNDTEGGEELLNQWLGKIAAALRTGRDKEWNIHEIGHNISKSFVTPLTRLMKGLSKHGRLGPINDALASAIGTSESLNSQAFHNVALAWSKEVIEGRWPAYEELLASCFDGKAHWIIKAATDYAAEFSFKWEALEEAIIDTMVQYNDFQAINAAACGAYYWANVEEGPWPVMEQIWTEKTENPKFVYNFSNRMAIYNSHVGREFFKMKPTPAF